MPSWGRSRSRNVSRNSRRHSKLYRFGDGQIRTGKTAPAPQLEMIWAPDFIQRETPKAVVGNTSGQGLGGLPQKVRGSTPEDEEATRPLRAVRQDAQDREQIRVALNLVNDDQPLQTLENQHGFGQTGQVFGILQVVEVGRPPQAFRKHSGQRSLADLSCADDPDHRESAEQPEQDRQLSFPFDHGRSLPGNLGRDNRIFKDQEQGYWRCGSEISLDAGHRLTKDARSARIRAKRRRGGGARVRRRKVGSGHGGDSPAESRIGLERSGQTPAL